MADLFEIKKGNDFVHAYFYGVVSFPLIEDFMKTLVKKAKQWGFNNYFIDFREAKKRAVGTFSEYDLAYQKTQEYGFDNLSRHALLVRDDHELSQWKFVETLFRNAGYCLTIFTDEAAALDWISNSKS